MATLILDDFSTGPDDTTINGKAPAPTNTPGNLWVVSAGSIKYESGKAQALVGGDRASVDCGVANLTLKCKLYDDGGGTWGGGLILRYTDDSNFIFAIFNGAGDTLTLFKKVSGSNTPLNSAAATAVNGTVLQVDASSDLLTVTYGAVNFSKTEAFNDTATKVGLYAGGGGSNRWDDFQVDGAAGGIAYTLSASVGSFTLTGQAATLLKSLHLASSPGSFTLTGKSATVSIGRPLSASAGSFVLTGRTATTSWSRSLSLSVGAFTVSGQSATFLTGKGLAGTSGSFVVTGQNTTLTSARSLSLSRGTFTLSGQSATPSVGRPLSATSGAFLLTGKTLTASIARIIAAGVGSFSVTGQSAQLAASNVILVSAIFRFDVQFARVQVHSPQFVYIQKFDVKFGGQ